MIIHLILCLLCLSACGGQPTGAGTPGSGLVEGLPGQGQGEPQGEQDPTEESKNWVCMAHISINPEFEMYLEERLHIVKVNCLNADAQAAFDDVDVLGMTLFDGLFILLDQAQGKGYVQNGMKMEVSLEVDLPVDLKDQQQLASDVEEQLQIALDQLKDTRGVSLNMDCTTTIIENPTEEEIPASAEPEDQGPGPQEDDQQENDQQVSSSQQADGVTVLHFTDNDNRKVIQHINAKGTIIYQMIEDENQVVKSTFDENGTLREEEARESNGAWSVSAFDAAGNLIREEIQFPDGVHVMREFAADGTVIAEEIYDPNRSNGQEEVITQFDANGNQMITWINSKGWLVREEEIMTDGQTSVTEYQYDENGIRVWSMLTFSNGTTVETTYQNGQRHIETSHDATNGYVQVHTYNENGVMISSISDAPDGFYSYQYFDDNGVLVRWDLQDFFGRDSHRTYRPDGSYIDRVYEPDVGKTLVIEYDAAGNQISYAEE